MGQELILSNGDAEELRSRIASLLLKGHGELLIPLGAHVSPSHLYTPSGSTDSTSIPTTGEALATSELDIALDRLRTACKGLNAELNELYRADGTYGCWSIRLTPRGVEEIMEVRVAVVGNVDAGKSTTLGVLTRGGLDDGRGKVGTYITASCWVMLTKDSGSSCIVSTPTRD